MRRLSASLVPSKARGALDAKGLAGRAEDPYRRVWLRARDLHLLLEVVSAEDETHVPELLKLLLDFGRLGLVIVRAS